MSSLFSSIAPLSSSRSAAIRRPVLGGEPALAPVDDHDRRLLAALQLLGDARAPWWTRRRRAGSWSTRCSPRRCTCRAGWRRRRRTAPARRPRARRTSRHGRRRPSGSGSRGSSSGARGRWISISCADRHGDDRTRSKGCVAFPRSMMIGREQTRTSAVDGGTRRDRLTRGCRDRGGQLHAGAGLAVRRGLPPDRGAHRRLQHRRRLDFVSIDESAVPSRAASASSRRLRAGGRDRRSRPARGPSGASDRGLQRRHVPDVAVSNFVDQNVAILLRQPNGSFAPGRARRSPLASQPGAIATGDFASDSGSTSR